MALSRNDGQTNLAACYGWQKLFVSLDVSNRANRRHLVVDWELYQRSVKFGDAQNNLGSHKVTNDLHSSKLKELELKIILCAAVSIH